MRKLARGPRIIVDVQIIGEDGLFDPLPRGVVPVRQPVDDDVVVAGLSKIERFDVNPLDFEADAVAPHGYVQRQLVEQRLVTDRPADVRAE